LDFGIITGIKKWIHDSPILAYDRDGVEHFTISDLALNRSCVASSS
jgi:hypothetical protein